MKKLMIVCSTSFYDRIPNILKELDGKFEIVLPNGYGEEEEDIDWDNIIEYSNFFKRMFLESQNKVKEVDACLVLNFDKVKDNVLYSNYIGASTFLEMYEAFMLNKEIYMYNDFPDNMLLDEMKAFMPIIINGDLSKINVK